MLNRRPPGLRPISVEDVALSVVHGLGLVAVLAGLVLLSGTSIGADPVEALGAMAGQLPTTLPAALLLAGAAAANLAAGAVLARAVAGGPFGGVAQAALAGMAGAVMLDGLLMLTLGSFGLFTWPALVLAHLPILVAAPWLRPLTRRRPALGRWPPRFPLAWLLILLVWSGPIALQLASPVVPFLDVLPNHVAPVEHLRTFGGLESLATSPTPIYGPSRIFLGYQATLGALATLTGVAAPLAVAAFCLPLTLLVGAAAFGLARAIGGRQAGMWALLLVPLSVTFLRLADARAGVMALPLAALALWLVIEPLGVTPRRQAVVLLAVLGAAILVHPLIGLLATGAVGLVSLVALVRRSTDVTPGLPAAVAASLIALPQWAAMAGLELPPWSGLLAIPVGLSALIAAEAVVKALGAAGAKAAGDARRERAWPMGYTVAALIAGALTLVGVLLVVDPAALGRLVGGPVSMLAQYPVLLAGAALAVLFAARRPGMEMLYVALLGVVLAAAATGLAPTGSTIGAAIRFEVPKTLTYFAPTILAICGAVGLAALWRRRRWPVAGRAALAGLLVVGAALPLRTEVVEALSLGEHRLSESLSISLHNAQHGYWRGFPDARRLVDRDQQALLDALRAEIDAGRITGATPVLHVASSFQPWASIPLAVFTGVMETTATLDPERSIHTEGGRLLDVAELPALLAEAYPYVVLEPAGLDPRLSATIEAAGFQPLFANDVAILYERPVITRLGP
jgi:hypothetical protein